MATVFRADHVGSLLAPAELAAARAEHAAGRLRSEQLRAAEDAAITAAVKLQQTAGLAAITDGQLRRSDPYAPFAAVVDGIVRRPRAAAGGDWPGAAPGYSMAGPLRARGPVFADEVGLLRELAPRTHKIALLGPASLACALHRGAGAGQHYSGIRDLATAFAPIVGQEIERLIAKSVPYVQLNCPAYTALLDPGYRSQLEAIGESPDALLQDLIALEAATLSAIERPAGTTLALRVGIRWRTAQAPGRHAATLEQVLGAVPVDRFLLEFRRPGADDFAPLRALPRGKMAVLGLIENDAAGMADIDGILDQLERAVQFAEAASLAISPGRGFASPGRSATADALARQTAVLELTGEIARRYWGIEL